MANDQSTSEADSQRESPPAKRGLGDLAGDFFAAMGISEERYKAAKVALHLDPTCGCAERKKWLNEMGQKLGVDGVVLKMAQWLDRRKG
jgi:hypothetical protein